MLGEAGYKPHKWHSNVDKLEAEAVSRDEGQTHAKEQMDVKPNEAKLLELPWNKREDTLAVRFYRNHKERSAKKFSISV